MNAISAYETEDARWEAVQARDAAADGHFVYAVRTTGAYCHPSSTAQLPNREHVEFFDSVEGAERAGYRPSRRAGGHEPGAVPARAAQAAAGWGKRTWQAIALGLGVVAASLLVSLVMLLEQPGPGTPTAAQMAAILTGPQGHTALLTLHGDRLVLTAVGPLAAPSGKAFELWMLPQQGKPQAVGLVSLGASDTLRLPAPALLALTQAKGFAISEEPTGGSPTGQPTGPIRYQGAVAAMTTLAPGAVRLPPGQGGGDFYE